MDPILDNIDTGIKLLALAAGCYLIYLDLKRKYFPTVEDLMAERQAKIDMENRRTRWLESIAKDEQEKQIAIQKHEEWIDMCIEANKILPKE